jgi:hypothetical protein
MFDRHTKTAQIIPPAWWYLVAAMPLAATWFSGMWILTPESYKYTFGGLRNIFVLNAVHFSDLIGLTALASIVIFIGSFYVAKLHNPLILKIFSAGILVLYGFWSVFMALWMMIK